MASRTVKSPTGASIEIVTDDDWAATAGIGIRSLRMWDKTKPYVIRELWEQGAAKDRSGGATQVLYDRMVSHFPGAKHSFGFVKSLATLMSQPVNAAAFDRDIRGKRTFRIELVAMPETWHRKLMRDIGGSMVTFTAIPVTAADSNGTEPEPAPFHDAILDNPNIVLPIEPEETSPVISVEIASQVAMEMLTKVVEIISAGSASGVSETRIRQLTHDMDVVASRLGQRVEENDRMRKQLRETGEELAAVKTERDSLRQRLRQTEANLKASLNGDSAHAVTSEVMKRVDRIMRETPQPKRGDT